MTTGGNAEGGPSIHRYGGDPSQLAELFLPEGAGPHAVVVVVHGGYWRARYDRSLMTPLCVDLAAHGLARHPLPGGRVFPGQLSLPALGPLLLQ